MREKELVKLRKKVYQLLKVNDATNKVSWWNLADDVVDLIESERERVCMDGYIDGHNDGRWISKKKLENEKEKYLKGFIIKMFGKRCKEYEVFCPVCEMWELCDEYIK